MAKRVGLWFAGAVGGVIVAAIAGALALPEVRAELLLKVSPKAFRDAGLFRFTNPAGDEVYLLGTIHGDHLTTPGYSLWNVGAVVRRLHPDRLLVEERPEEVARGHLGDGPIEMPFAALTAKAMGVEVRGIDWWTMNAEHAVDPPEREAHILANVRAGLAGAHRALILTGFSHVDALAPQLEASGWRPAAFADADKEALFDTAGQPSTFPAGMDEAIRTRIADDGSALAKTSDSFWKERLAAAIKARQALLVTIARTGER